MDQTNNNADERRPTGWRKRKVSSTRVAFNLLAIAIAGLLMYAIYTCSDQRVFIPNVVGLSYEEAVKRIEDEGLIPVDSLSDNGRFEKDYRVIDQVPIAGKVQPGTEIRLNVTPPPVTIPDVRGMTRQGAEKKLQDAGIYVEQVIIEQNEDVSQGLVIRVEGPPTAPPGTGIVLVVSRGDGINTEIRDMIEEELRKTTE